MTAASAVVAASHLNEARPWIDEQASPSRRATLGPVPAAHNARADAAWFVEMSSTLSRDHAAGGAPGHALNRRASPERIRLTFIRRPVLRLCRQAPEMNAQRTQLSGRQTECEVNGGRRRA